MFLSLIADLICGAAYVVLIVTLSGVLNAQQRTAGAETKVSKAATPDLSRLHLDSVRALEQGNLSKARAGFESLVKRQPNSAEYHDLLGYVLMLQGEPKQAITVLQKAVELDPKRKLIVAHLAEALAQSGELSVAVSTFQRAAKLGPLDGPTHIAYAHALSAMGSNDEAIAELGTAIEMQPENASAHDDLGAVLVQQQKYADAEEQFKKAVKLSPDLASAHLHLGVLYFQQNDLQRAVP